MFAELFGVLPEDFMRKYLANTPGTGSSNSDTNPTSTEKPRVVPFLEDCQAANFSESSDSMMLNVTQVRCNFCPYISTSRLLL